jgi:hypothetical protein
MADTAVEQLSQSAEFKMPEKLANPAQTLEQSLSKLGKFGGFDFLESGIDGVASLNPERKARKNIFLTEAGKKQERQDLKKKLTLWMSLISESQDINEMVEKCNSKTEVASATLKKNLKKALEATHELETSYRSVSLFFANTQSDKVKNVTFVNAALDSLKDLDNPRFIEYISNELSQNYDRLDLRNNYSLMCVPGYLGSNKVVEKWARMAHKNKVMMVTDFLEIDKADDVIEMFNEANFSGGDVFKANVMMTCNWVVGRAKNKELGEEDDLMVPPSASLAGKMYSTPTAQVAAGKTFGSLNEVDGVRFDLKKSEISMLDKIGVIPMVNEYSKVMAFSAKTLFNGDNLGLQTYSVVRVFDYINKVLIDFLNRRAFENWSSRTENDLRAQMIKFLDSIQGPTTSSLIEKFNIARFERDENQKDRIYLDINITPYFPAKSFVLKLDGMKGDGGTQWDTKTEAK